MIIVRRPPTARQRQILDFIEGFQARNSGVSPSLDEIAEHFRVSRQGAFSMVEGLVKRGLVTKGYHEGRSIRIVREEMTAA